MKKHSKILYTFTPRDGVSFYRLLQSLYNVKNNVMVVLEEIPLDTSHREGGEGSTSDHPSSSQLQSKFHIVIDFPTT